MAKSKPANLEPSTMPGKERRAIVDQYLAAH